MSVAPQTALVNEGCGKSAGTEPKIKVYLSAVGKSEAEADAVNAELAKAAEMLMK